jgi:hypothetical protein
MKTICRLPDFEVPDVSLYLFADDKPVDITPDRTIVGDPQKPDFIVLDCNTSNCVLNEGVVEPSGWYGWKYTHTIASGWALNPSWVDPLG